MWNVSRRDSTAFQSHSLMTLPPGWNKALLSVDALEENGYSSGEDPATSDPEDDPGKKLVSFTLTA